MFITLALSRLDSGIEPLTNMALRKRITLIGTLAFFMCSNAFPADSKAEYNRQPRQDDDDSNRSQNFGANIAQIIAGAFTGNIDSIIKGSFGFIEDPNVNKLSHNTWETLKGNTTPPPTTEKADSELEPEPPVPAAPPKTQTPPPPPSAAPVAVPPPPPVAEVAAPILVAESAPAPGRPLAVAPPPPIVETVPAQSAPSFPYAPDVYYPGSSNYPTRSPVRTKQPTYATLAPLSVIEGTATEKETAPVEQSTLRTTTEEDDDGDDAEESLSAEVGDNVTGTTEVSKLTPAATNSQQGQGPTKPPSSSGSNVETTTEEDEDQEEDYRLKA